MEINDFAAMADNVSVARFYRPRSIRAFFRNAWEINEKSKFYIVFMAQRCLNLNEIYFREWLGLLCAFSQNTDEYDAYNEKYRQVIISQSAWHLKAEEMIDYYVCFGHFPQSYLFDELVISGCDIGATIFQMLDALWAAYQRRSMLTESVKSKIRRDFLSSVTIKIYARTDKTILLEDDILNRLSWVQKFDSANMWLFVDQICKKITSDTVTANTSYIPTFNVPKCIAKRLQRTKDAETHWSILGCNYEGRTTDIWQRAVFPSNGRLRMHECFCVHLQEKDTSCQVTPYLILGRLTDFQLKGLFRRVRDVLDYYDSRVFQPLIKILSLDYMWAKNIKLHLCVTLLSILRFYAFISEIAPQFSLDMLKVDLEKVAKNYGTVSDIFPALHQLCGTDEKSRELRNGLSNVMISYIYEKAAPISCCDFDDGGSDDLLNCISVAEDYFIRLDDQEYISRLSRWDKQAQYTQHSHFYEDGNCLSEYFWYFSREKLFSAEAQIAAFFILVDNGIVGYRSLLIKEESVYQKVGERTSLIMAKRVKNYLPALIELERICKQLDFTLPYWAEQYGVYLERSGNRRGLGKLFRTFTEWAYDRRQSIADFQLVSSFWCENPNSKEDVLCQVEQQRNYNRLYQFIEDT